MTRLVALDVDGTLLDEQSLLPEARVAALAALGAAGIPTVLVTGKTWPSIREVWERCSLDGPHVCCNGSAIVTRQARLVAITPLEDATVEIVTATLLDHDVAYAVYLDDGSSVTERDHPDLAVIEAAGEARPAVGAPDSRRVLKVLSVVGEEGEGSLRALDAPAARVQRTSTTFLEWNAARVDKGTGLTQVASLLGTPLEHVVAVGDAESDVPMFAVAGTGVAVDRASPGAIAAADLHLAGRDLTDYLRGLAG